MKLLIFGHNYSPELTGIGKYTGEMAAWLAGRGHEVHVITGLPYYPQWKIDEAYRGNGFQKEVIDDVHVYRTPLYIPDAQQLSAARRILHETSFTLASLRWWLPMFLARERFDVVIAICPFLQTGLLPALYSKLFGTPWIFHVQDLQVDAALRLGMIKNKQLGYFLHAAESRLLNGATRVSTISESMRRRLHEKGVSEQATLLLPNWSDLSFVRPLTRENPVRKRLGAGTEDILVLYSGNMGEKQGLELILEAAGHTKHESRIKFALVGSGAARYHLEQNAKRQRLSNVAFYDLVPWEEMPELLAAGDIHLVIQKQDAADLVMPSKLTNILAAGRPSIVTAAPGTELYHVFQISEAGLVIQPGDAKRLAEAIELLAGQPERRSFMGRNARDYSEQTLDKETILAEFAGRLNDICIR